MDPQDPAEVDDLLYTCLELPDDRWEIAIEETCCAHPALAPALRRRFENLRLLGLTGTEGASSDELSCEELGEFRILKPIGGGGMGVVYLAWWMTRARPVALKLLRAEGLRSAGARRRFRREMELMQRLDHPGVCRVYAYGEEDGAPYIAMQLVEGPSMAESIAAARRRGDLPSGADLRAVLECFESLAGALDAAHARGLVHRDVKPANVLLEPDGRPILVDFGLARQLEGETSFQTDARACVGTPAYVAPELLGGAVPDARADVYALGVSLYERLTLELPWNAPTWQALVLRVEREPEPDPRRRNPAVPAALALVVRTAMAKDPRRRYQSARALAADLAAVREGRPTAARKVGVARAAARWATRYPAAAALVVLLITGLAGTGWLTLRLRSTLRESRALGLAAVADPVETGDPDLSVLLARRAVVALEHPTTLSRLLEVLGQYHAWRPLWKHDARARLCAYSADGTRLLLLVDRNLLAVVDLEHPERGPSTWRPTSGSVVGARVSRDGTQVLAVDDAGRARRVETAVRSRRAGRPGPGHGPGARLRRAWRGAGAESRRARGGARRRGRGRRARARTERARGLLARRVAFRERKGRRVGGQRAGGCVGCRGPTAGRVAGGSTSRRRVRARRAAVRRHVRRVEPGSTPAL